MEIEISDNLLMGAGALMGSLSIALLGATNIFGFSPVLKVLMLFLLATLFLVAGLYFDKTLESVAHLIGATSLVAGLYQTISFNLGMEVYFLLTVFGSITLIGLGYVLQQDILNLNSTVLAYSAVIIIVSIGILASYDLSGAKPRHVIINYEKPKINDAGDLELGSLIMHNTFSFPRKFSVPEYQACLRTNSSTLVLPLKAPETQIVEGRKLKEFKLALETRSEIIYDLDSGGITVAKADRCHHNMSEGIYIIEPRDKPEQSY